MENIDKSAWKELVKSDDNAVILDVRTPEECAEGMQENAVQMNYLDTQSFQQNIQKLDSSKTYYVYCRSGARSANACQMMEGVGLNCKNLLGGMLEWDGKVVQAL